MTLDELAILYGTDKSSQHHNYTPLYEKYFEELRENPVHLLELGWGGYEYPDVGGESAGMWRDYFPNATITVLDIHEKNNRIKGVNFVQGNQESALVAKGLLEKYGKFEIIIDDASHISSLTIQSFRNLFHTLVSGGIYVIEDLHSSYDPSYYGGDEADDDPNTFIQTTMSFLKSLTDEVNKDFLIEEYRIGFDIEFIHFYKDICFIKKK